MTKKLKQNFIFFLSITWILFSYTSISADIAPNPIVGKGIYTVDSCKIQLLSETVIANISPDSSTVECTFELFNHSDSISIEIGFPVMEFDYWRYEPYQLDDKTRFQINVDGKILSTDQIQVPDEMDSVYSTYMEIFSAYKEYNEKRDSILKANNIDPKKSWIFYPKEVNSVMDSLYRWLDKKPKLDSELYFKFKNQMAKGNFPWYVWKVSFKKNERKIIKLSYKMPAGIAYGDEYRYFKYLLNTGAGWYGKIQKADIIVALHNLSISDIDEIKPANYRVNKMLKIITWRMLDFDPTKEDDIYLKYNN